MLILRFSVALLLACALATTSKSQSPLVESYLLNGESAVGVTAVRAQLAKQPTDAQAQFGLGVVEFISAVETLGQSFYRYGLRDTSSSWGMGLPLLRLPVPENANPEPLSYPAARKILQTFIDDLATAEKSLAKFADPSVKLPLHVSDIQLDFVGNGTQPVALSTILQRMGAVPDQRELMIAFDQADATWLRGYCNVLSAMCEFALAHDGEELFNATAHVFFRSPQSPLSFLQQSKSVYRLGETDLSDLIAFIHLLRLPVVEPERMQNVLKHLQNVLTLSGQMWQQVVEETDDDREWIPNTQQQGVLGIAVTQEMIDSWLLATKEGLEVLQGERLIPFWRGDGEQGVNLRRVFTEPTTFDLLLWIQGSAAAPYLEKGEMTRPEVWEQLLQVFRGNFVVFALWFN